MGEWCGGCGMRFVFFKIDMIMKKVGFVFLMLMGCWMVGFGQSTMVDENKRVVVLDVVDEDGSVGYGAEYMIRSYLTFAISDWYGFVGKDGVDMELINQDKNFERLGELGEVLIKQLRESYDADYILVPKALSKDGKEVTVEAYLYDGMSGRLMRSEMITMQMDVSMYEGGCYRLVRKLLSYSDFNHVGELDDNNSVVNIENVSDVKRVENKVNKKGEKRANKKNRFKNMTQPEYPGGETAMYDYISKNIVYPEKAREIGIEGRVLITFVVEKDGSISNIKMIKDIGGGCGRECVRVVSEMPKWTPGHLKDGTLVRCNFTLPLSFNLND